jgi:hypothetical protein
VEAKDSEDPFWSLAVGYGESQPGWGDTKERVKTADLILRYVQPEESLRGRDWYLNRRSLIIEGAYHHLISPDEPPIFGVYFLSCWTFLTNERLRPYLLAGGGPVYTKAEIPGTSSKVRGSYQFGAGLEYLIENRKFTLEFRFHHLSNGGTKDPNDPLNSAKLLLGFNFDI